METFIIYNYMLPYSPLSSSASKDCGNMVFCKLENNLIFFKNLKYCIDGIKTIFKNDGDVFFDQITSLISF